MARLGLDFGTSNTSAAAPGGKILALEPGAATIPTALFFDPYNGDVLYGRAAVDALISGREGRFLRALKSVLGQPILRETRALGGERTTLLQIVARFLARVKSRAEAESGQTFTKVLSGRPVRFHSRNPAYNDQAERDLAEAYRLAGFEDIQFMAEPEAAALASGGVADGYGLVVDIGGGTSDYSVFRGTGDGIQIVSNHGIRLGGTDFDRLLNIDRVMPRLGLGSLLKNELGSGQTPAPRALFHDLASWEKIPFQYTPQTIRQVRHMAKLAVEAGPWARLLDVLEMELAHDIAHNVEMAKISANGGPANGIDLGVLRKGASLPLDEADIARVLGQAASEIGAAALDAVAAAGVAPGAVTRVVMVGGSSLMRVIEAEVQRKLPAAQIDRSDAFTAIVDGLAIAADRLG